MSDASMKEAVIACRGLRKIYQQGKVEVPVLLSIDFEVARGERVAIVGASGKDRTPVDRGATGGKPSLREAAEAAIRGT